MPIPPTPDPHPIHLAPPPFPRRTYPSRSPPPSPHSPVLPFRVQKAIPFPPFSLLPPPPPVPAPQPADDAWLRGAALGKEARKLRGVCVRVCVRVEGCVWARDCTRGAEPANPTEGERVPGAGVRARVCARPRRSARAGDVGGGVRTRGTPPPGTPPTPRVPPPPSLPPQFAPRLGLERRGADSGNPAEPARRPGRAQPAAATAMRGHPAPAPVPAPAPAERG